MFNASSLVMVMVMVMQLHYFYSTLRGNIVTILLIIVCCQLPAQESNHLRLDSTLFQDTLKPDIPNGSRMKESGISVADWISIVASISTLITALLTYLLLRETQKTLKLSVETSARESKRMEAEATNTVNQNFKNTYLAMIGDKDALQFVAKAEGSSKKKAKMDVYSSFLINNVHEIYGLREKGFIPDQEWESIKLDIVWLFEYPFVENRWSLNKQYYSKDFQDFINSVLSAGGK